MPMQTLWQAQFVSLNTVLEDGMRMSTLRT